MKMLSFDTSSHFLNCVLRLLYKTGRCKTNLSGLLWLYMGILTYGHHFLRLLQKNPSMLLKKSRSYFIIEYLTEEYVSRRDGSRENIL